MDQNKEFIPQINVENNETEILTNETLGNLISSMGNLETKANLLRIMKPGILYSRSDLRRVFNDSQGKNIGWSLGTGSLAAYCSGTFVPIGLVAAEIIDKENNIYGYKITEYGERVGLPLAGLLLNFSLNHPEISLVKIFGSTHSNTVVNPEILEKQQIDFKKRSPTNRVKIFYELATSAFPLRLIDLASNIDEDINNVSNHIQELKRYGLLNYEAARRGESVSRFKINPDKLKFAFQLSSKRSSTLPINILEILKSNPEKNWGLNEITETLLSKYDIKKYKNMNEVVRAALVALEEQDLLAKQSGFFDKNIQK